MNAMVALDRCRRAWERTSPQLVIDGWLDMLDELDTSEVKRAGRVPPAAASLVSSPSSPVASHRDSPGGGLDSTTRGSAADPALETRGAAQKGA
jgi:hypothetical protein